MSRPVASRATLLPVVLVIVAMASIQAGAAIAKQLFPVVGSTGAASLRLLFASIILVVLLRPWRARLDAAAWRSIVVYGVALGGMNTLFYASIRTLPLGVAVAFEITGPLAVAVLSSRRAIDFVWIALAVCGLLLLLPLREAAAGVDPVGAAFALGAGACWALYILFGQRAGAEHGVQATAVAMVVGTVVILPLGVLSAGPALFTPSIIPYGIAVAILSTALPYTLEMVALRRLPARTFGTLMSLQPAFAALSGLVLLREQLGAVQWLAIATIIAASTGTTLTAAQARAAPSPDAPA